MGCFTGVALGQPLARTASSLLLEHTFKSCQDLPCPVLSLLGAPLLPSAGSPTPTHNRTDSSRARMESLHNYYSPHVSI